MSPKAKYLKRHTVSPAAVIWAILLFIGYLSFFAARWFVSTYGRLGFDSILFTLNSDLHGVQSGLLTRFTLLALLPAVSLTAVTQLLLLRLLRGWMRVTAAVILVLFLICFAAWDVELDDYLLDQIQESDLYEKHYVDPDSVSITFPEEKRNLVYIMLESMETTYLSKALGGGVEVNLIPELHELAADNINFSHNSGVGGFYCTSGATWTIGAMVAQTAGIPLKTPTEDVNDYGKEGEAFLPGVTSLTSILRDEGYYQALMVGSNADFGGRRAYFTQHGMDMVYDLYTARKDGIVPRDYFVWWGMEDLHLFEYARQELTEIAAQDQPFAFTLLTVDTHHVGGYQCEFCTDSISGETYDQSISCSSRQVAEFVSWLQAQDFYENTTVVIVGDHETMDNGYIQRNVADSYQRMVYNCFLNSAAEVQVSKNRKFTAVDLFPTTLAAMGCQIEGNHLGLGTNLFSSSPTLAERMGFLRFDDELAKSSDYYEANFY
ncbi:MAG: LTA synthase family protein [Oscillospiraceae bacterium]|nr:LTA synthase family protein [Oscillospiraceae bacterium]